MRSLKNLYPRADLRIISLLRSLSDPLGRFTLFIVFFWFGALKLISESPANELVHTLLSRTLPGVPFYTFIVLLGTYEMLIGLFFLFPRFERAAIALLFPHFIATLLPLFLLPGLTWSAFLIPTLEGQYIIKNLIIVSLAVFLGAHLRARRP